MVIGNDFSKLMQLIHEGARLQAQERWLQSAQFFSCTTELLARPYPSMLTG